MSYSTKYNQSYALVIEINAYRFAAPLEIARADAEAISHVLCDSLGFLKRNVTTLFDAKATRARIMEAFLSYDTLNPDDRLFVFFAGHGATVDRA